MPGGSTRVSGGSTHVIEESTRVIEESTRVIEESTRVVEGSHVRVAVGGALRVEMYTFGLIGAYRARGVTSPLG